MQQRLLNLSWILDILHYMSTLKATTIYTQLEDPDNLDLSVALLSPPC